MRAFLVTLPSWARYWTVVDDGYRVVRVGDEYLRLGRDANRDLMTLANWKPAGPSW